MVSDTDHRPIVVLIATNTEFEAFLKVAADKADTILAVQKSTLHSRSFEREVIKTANPFDHIYKLLIGEQEVIAIHTAESIRRTARAVDYAVWYHHPKFIINFGTAGALKPSIEKAGIYLAETVVQADFDISGGVTKRMAKKLKQPYIAPGQHPGYDSPYLTTDEELRALVKNFNPAIQEVCVASGNKFVFGQDKQNIVTAFNAELADMEAAGVVLTCNEEHVPALVLKCISDGVDASATEYYEAAANVSEACSTFVLDFIASL